MFLAQSDKPCSYSNLSYHAAPRPSSQIPPKADPRPQAASPGDPELASRLTTNDCQPINQCKSVVKQAVKSAKSAANRSCPARFQLTITDPMRYNTPLMERDSPQSSIQYRASSTQHPNPYRISGLWSGPHSRSLSQPHRPRPPTDTENRQKCKTKPNLGRLRKIGNPLHAP